jgi:hypothetical protein
MYQNTMNLISNNNNNSNKQQIESNQSLSHVQIIHKKKHECSIICPSYEYLIGLSINTDLICTVPNCDEIFSNSSALNLHLEKVHRLNQSVILI